MAKHNNKIDKNASTLICQKNIKKPTITYRKHHNTEAWYIVSQTHEKAKHKQTKGTASGRSKHGKKHDKKLAQNNINKFAKTKTRKTKITNWKSTRPWYGMWQNKAQIKQYIRNQTEPKTTETNTTKPW